MRDIVDTAISPPFEGEGGAVALMNVRAGAIDMDTVTVLVSEILDASGRRRASSVALRPQVAVELALQLLLRATASWRFEPREMVALAERLDHLAEFLRDWNAAGTRKWHEKN